MKSHMIKAVLALIFMFQAPLANAAVCVVTTENDTGASGSFRYFVEATADCTAGEIQDAKAKRDGDRSIDYSIMFQTREALSRDNRSHAVDVIKLGGSNGPVDFNPRSGDLLIGNYSADAVFDSASEIDYLVNAPGTPGYVYDISGTGLVYDYGVVAVDAREYETWNGMPGNQRGSNMRDSLFFKCTDADHAVILRNMVIYTHSFSQEQLFRGLPETSCFYNGGNVHLCQGDPVKKSNGNDDFDRNPSTEEFCVPLKVEDEDPTEEEEPCPKKTVYLDSDNDGYGTQKTFMSSGQRPNRSSGNGSTQGSTQKQSGATNKYKVSKAFDGPGAVRPDLAIDIPKLKLDQRRKTLRICEDDPIPAGYVENNGDCNDNASSINPDAEEVCDGRDNNCDELIDISPSGLASVCADEDGDGYDETTDCDDTDFTVNPGATEICGNDTDENCDGVADECGGTDADGDGYTSSADGGTDCNDANSAIHPGATDICENGVDEDCSGSDAICTVDNDLDNDGYDADVDCDDSDHTIHPGATDICSDGIDQNCDGQDADCTFEICDSGIDEDGDDLVDCEDSDCTGASVCTGGPGEENCEDELDGPDLDGLIDCADPDCRFTDACFGKFEYECGDEVDNDGDGFQDCEDKNCADFVYDEVTGATCASLGLGENPPTDNGAQSGGGCGCDLTSTGSGTANHAQTLLITALFGLIVIFRSKSATQEG